MTAGEKLYMEGHLEEALPMLRGETKEGDSRAWFFLGLAALYGMRSFFRKAPFPRKDFGKRFFRRRAVKTVRRDFSPRRASFGAAFPERRKRTWKKAGRFLNKPRRPDSGRPNMNWGFLC